MREAVEVLTPTYAAVELARARCMLGSRAEVPDDEAVELLRAALETALDRGALGIQRRARAALARRGRPDESGRDAQRCPTSTERRIVELAAAGLGVRDVAQQLFLTPGTVQAVLESTSGNGFKFVLKCGGGSSVTDNREDPVTQQQMVPPAVSRAEPLRGLCGGSVQLPGDPAYDMARSPWNLQMRDYPAAVAYPAFPDEVAEVLRAAAAAGLQVAAQGTGHGAPPLEGRLGDAVLLRTSAMTELDIDADRRTVRAGRRRAVGRPRRRRRTARAGRPAPVVPGRRGGRLLPRRRHRLVRPEAGAAVQRGHAPSSWCSPTGRSCGRPPTGTPSCSGRCAAERPRWAS